MPNFMFILLISNHTVFLVQLTGEFHKKLKLHSSKQLVLFQLFERFSYIRLLININNNINIKINININTYWLCNAFAWYAMKCSASHLYFLGIHMKPLGDSECVYQKNTSDKWYMYTARKHFITTCILYHAIEKAVANTM